MKQKAYDAYKAILDKKNEVVKPMEAALQSVNRRLGEWAEEQEAERQRLEAEEVERANRQAEKDRQKELKKLRSKGYDEASVQAMATQAVVPVVREVAPTYEKGGLTTRKTYSGAVVDLHALIKFVAKNKRYAYLLKIDQAELNKLVRSMREDCDLPGVRVETNTTVASGRK
jgi:NCAIR mutase (PurE)-related protein